MLTAPSLGGRPGRTHKATSPLPLPPPWLCLRGGGWRPERWRAAHRRTTAAHLCREVPVVQEKQGVPRLGGVGDQLVTSLLGNHGNLVGELRLRAAGPSAQGPHLPRCAPRQQGPQAAQPLPLRAGGGAPAVLLPPQHRGGPGGAGVTGSGAQDELLQGRGQHSGTAAAQAWKNLLRCCAETLGHSPPGAQGRAHTRGRGAP